MCLRGGLFGHIFLTRIKDGKVRHFPCQINKLIRRERTAVEMKITNQGDSRDFFRYAKSRIGSAHRVSALKTQDGAVHTCPESLAELFAQHFSSMFVVDDGPPIHGLPHSGLLPGEEHDPRSMARE